MTTLNPVAPAENAKERQLFQFNRDVATRLGRTQERTVTTTDATATEIWSREIPPNSVAHVIASVVGLRSDFAAAAGYTRFMSFRRTGTGAVTAIGTATTISQEDDAAWDVTVTAGATTGEVAVNVVGVAATTISWTASVTILVGMP
jgi:hypothetical protein